MARGWESKSVEDQVAEAEAAREARSKPRVTQEQRDKESERQSLLLSKAQIKNRLRLATHPRYRTQLESALEDLEGRLGKLNEG